ncbi:MAG: tRNA (N6-isopentenyl adenosine(37)-C2)-methylthiotransferase MiaB [Acidobacteria bacterium]|nr:tRNA (N6-isopentenyl adenosine(37)-C2)-methylthiotransferase MiaB [Acidobacteriota bacterium]
MKAVAQRRQLPVITAPRGPAEGVPPGSGAKYFIETWGCQMNAHDSQRMAGILAGMGYRPAAGPGDADLILLNTCAVRERAEQKVFTRLGELRRLKRTHPGVLIGLCGCLAQLRGEDLLAGSGRGVDFLMGPRGIGELSERIREARRTGRSIDLAFRSDAVLYGPDEVAHDGFPKAFVNVMEGCNMNCTFCIIPRTRGREVYRPAPRILEEVRRLADRGFLEVELLGQTVNAYRDGPARLPDLIESIHEVPGIRRIRFTTSHPVLMSSPLMDCVRDLPKVCPYLHLPVQSGSNRILHAMRRGYDRDLYREKISYLRRGGVEIGLGTDIIVGFPGETETDHRDTLDLVRETGFDILYSFKFSPRPGTVAAALPGQVPEAVKGRRLQELQTLQLEMQRQRNRRFLGRMVEILVTGPSRRGGGELTGRTGCNRAVTFSGPDRLRGRIVSLRVVGADVNHLDGERREAPEGPA